MIVIGRICDNNSIALKMSMIESIRKKIIDMSLKKQKSRQFNTGRHSNIAPIYCQRCKNRMNDEALREHVSNLQYWADRSPIHVKCLLSFKQKSAYGHTNALGHTKTQNHSQNSLGNNRVWFNSTCELGKE